MTEITLKVTLKVIDTGVVHLDQLYTFLLVFHCHYYGRPM